MKSRTQLSSAFYIEKIMSGVTDSRKKLHGIQTTLRNILPELKESYGVKSLGVFGSYARGDQEDHSDLDLLAEFDRAPTIFEFVRLRRHLASKLGVNVDLLMRSALKPNIGKLILRELAPV